MTLKKTKCWILHLGWGSPGRMYTLKDERLESSLKERAVGDGKLNHQAFDTISHSILVTQLRKHEINEWMERWIENWLIGIVQRVVISGRASVLESCN